MIDDIIFILLILNTNNTHLYEWKKIYFPETNNLQWLLLGSYQKYSDDV